MVTSHPSSLTQSLATTHLLLISILGSFRDYYENRVMGYVTHCDKLCPSRSMRNQLSMLTLEFLTGENFLTSFYWRKLIPCSDHAGFHSRGNPGSSEPLKIKDLSIGLHQDIRKCVHRTSCAEERAEEQVVNLEPDPLRYLRVQMWALYLMARTSVATGAGNYRLGRGFSIKVRNEFQILLSIPRSHNWPQKWDCLQIAQQARKTIWKPFQSDILEGACLQRTLAKFPGCEYLSQSRKWKEKHVLFHDTMKSFVQQIDVIISLYWIHYPLLRSGCGCFWNFCTFRLVESTERMVLKTSFQTLQGHSFVCIYFPFPTLSLAPNPAPQISSAWQEGWSQQGLCQVLPWALLSQAFLTLLST